MERVDLTDFLLIAEGHLGIDAKTLWRLPRVQQLAPSALAAPFAGYGDFEPYPTLAAKAAIYCSRIVANHPLPDGNKRTGTQVMIEFIERNGYTFTHPDGDQDATAQMVEDLAAGKVSEDDFIAWVAERISGS